LCINNFVLLDVFISLLHQETSIITKPNSRFYLRIVLHQNSTHERWRDCKNKMSASKLYVTINAVNAISIFVVTIKTQFILHKQDNQQTGSETDCQPDDV